MTQPLTVSVIIPTYNGARWLGDCLHSVLRQSVAPSQVIVINDASTDGTAAVLQEFAAHVTVVPHASQQGIGAARNSGLRRASGDFLAFLDHDDLWLPHKLADQLALARSQPDLAVIHADAEEFGDEGVIHRSFFEVFPGLRNSAGIFEEIVHMSVPLMSTVLVRADFLRRHCLDFDTAASGVDDIGLFLQIAALGGRFGYVDAILTRRRLHAHNLSKVHLNRFEKRIVLYGHLLERLSDAAPKHRQALRWGLRHAHFCVGEWHWGQQRLDRARQHFRAAWGADRVGCRAALFGLASCLPGSLVQRLQQTKRRWQARLDSAPAA